MSSGPGSDTMLLGGSIAAYGVLRLRDMVAIAEDYGRRGGDIDLEIRSINSITEIRYNI